MRQFAALGGCLLFLSGPRHSRPRRRLCSTWRSLGLNSRKPFNSFPLMSREPIHESREAIAEVDNHSQHGPKHRISRTNPVRRVQQVHSALRLD